MSICTVVGARPNFMKAAPIIHEFQRRGISHVLVHTGQHYSAEVSDFFFRDLRLPAPDFHLGIGSDTHARQTARIMMAIEEVWLRERPELVLVMGDVNSTVAASLVASKLGVPVAHVEAGLRSFDRTMPEELNRIVTDHLSDLLFTTEESGNQNLAREGIPSEKIHFVGNCMVDTLLAHLESAARREPWKGFGLHPKEYGLVTLHRPSNVDNHETLSSLTRVLNEISNQLPLLFPVHPRTRGRLRDAAIELAPGLRTCEPLSYLIFLGLMARSKCVLTDSGGIQEEATVLGVPCLTLRDNTERPSTQVFGTNRLVGTEPARILEGFRIVVETPAPATRRPPLWDGRAALRLVDVIESWMSGRADLSGA